MVWLWNNLIEDAVLTPSSELLAKEVDNIKDYNLSKYFSFVGNSGNVVIDLNQAELISDFIIPGTNITDGYTTIKLEGNNSDSWGAPAYSIDLDLYKNGYVGAKGINQTFQYWRVVLEDSTIVNLQLGYCFISGRLQLPGIDPAVSLQYNNKSRRNFSLSQNLYADEGIDYFSAPFNFPLITEDPIILNGKQIATREDLLEFWYFNKAATPFIMIIWDNDRVKFPPILGTINQDSFIFTMNNDNVSYSLNFDFVETK